MEGESFPVVLEKFKMWAKDKWNGSKLQFSAFKQQARDKKLKDIPKDDRDKKKKKGKRKSEPLIHFGPVKVTKKSMVRPVTITWRSHVGRGKNKGKATWSHVEYRQITYKTKKGSMQTRYQYASGKRSGQFAKTPAALR